MRTEFPAKIRAQAFSRCNGRCESCAALLRPGHFTYDHRIPDYMGGPATLDNCQVLCHGCDKPKTAKDQASIGKSRRIIKRQAGVKKPRTIRTWRRFNGDKVLAPRERT